MAILINKNTRVLIQGITGTVGSFQARVMKDYGTQIVAGTTPGKGGMKVHDIPVYDFVAEAMAEHQIDAAFGFVPGWNAKDAALEVSGSRYSIFGDHYRGCSQPGYDRDHSLCGSKRCAGTRT